MLQSKVQIQYQFKKNNRTELYDIYSYKILVDKKGKETLLKQSRIKKGLTYADAEQYVYNLERNNKTNL